MADEKIIKFFEGVLSKTRAGKIPWEPTAQESKFIAAIGGEFTFSISSWTDIDRAFAEALAFTGSSRSQPKYALVLRDQIGTELAKVTENDEGIRRDDLQELYETARRQAVRAGERIDDVLEVLNKL
jgi:hypothetical protein